MLKRAAAVATLLMAACGGDPPSDPTETARAPARAPVPAPGEPPADSEPPAAARPGAGSADATAPMDEAPSPAPGAQRAAQVLQTYFALIEAGRYDDAWRLRWKGRGDDAASRRAFAESFERYAAYRATVGAPGRVEGAAGSLYVDIPVQIYGRMKDGTGFGSAGTVTLRRVNDVPGATAEEKSWRIYSRE